MSKLQENIVLEIWMSIINEMIQMQFYFCKQNLYLWVYCLK